MTSLPGGRLSLILSPLLCSESPVRRRFISYWSNSDVSSCRWTTPDVSTWTRVGKDPQPFNLYMFQSNNPISKIHQVKEYVTGNTELSSTVTFTMKKIDWHVVQKKTGCDKLGLQVILQQAGFAEMRLSSL